MIVHDPRGWAGRDEFARASTSVTAATRNSSQWKARKGPYLAPMIDDVSDCARSSWVGRDEFARASVIVTAATRNSSQWKARKGPHLAPMIDDVSDCARSSWMGRDEFARASASVSASVPEQEIILERALLGRLFWLQ